MSEEVRDFLRKNNMWGNYCLIKQEALEEHEPVRRACLIGQAQVILDILCMGDLIDFTQKAFELDALLERLDS